MFERIVIREVNRDCGEKMRILFDLKSGSRSRERIVKVAMKQKKFVENWNRRPSELGGVYQVRPGWRFVSGCRTPGGRRVGGESEKKRNISDELLQGIDCEVRSNHTYRLNKPGRLRLVHNYRKPTMVSFHRVSVFDETVPESITIVSKTPVIKKLVL